MKRVHRHSLFLLAALLIAGVTVMVGPAAAQENGEINLTVEPESSTLQPGETQTYEVIVESPDSGIGAYDGVVVDLSDPSVGDIVDFEEQFDNESGYSNSEIQNNNATLYLEAVTADSFAAPADQIVVATFELQAAETAVDGDETNIAFDSSASQSVADFENIAPYTVTEFRDASVTVTTLAAGEIDLVIEPETSALGPGETQTYEVVVRGPDSGIGAYDEVTVDLSDPSVGDIVGFEEQFDNESGYSNSEIRNNNATLYLEAFTGESFAAPADRIVIATFELQAAETATDGDTTDVVFDSSAAQAVADFENIAPYDVVDFEEANMTVDVEFPAILELASVDAPEEIYITDELEIEYTVENQGDALGTESAVELVIDVAEPTVEDTDTDLAVGPGESADGTLVFDDFESLAPGVTIDYTVRLNDFEDNTSGSTTIADGEPGASVSSLDIAGQGADANITEGQDEPVSVALTNTGTLAAEFSMSLIVYEDGFEPVFETNKSSEEIQPGETGTVVFEGATGQLGAGEYTVELAANSAGDDDTTFGGITITEPESTPELSNLDIAGQGTSATIVEGASEPVSVDVANVGAGPGSFDVAVDILAGTGERVARSEQSTDVLGPGGTENIVFEGVTGRLDPGAYTVDVTTDVNVLSGEVTVEANQDPGSQLSNLDIAGQGSAATVVEGEDVEVAVDVENVGETLGVFDITVNVSTLAGEPDSTHEQTTGTLEPGETETIVFEGVTNTLSPDTYVLDVSTGNDTLFGEITVDGNNASLLSNLDIAGQGATGTLLDGESADVTVEVTNVFDASKTIDLTLQVGGEDAAGATTGPLDPGEGKTITFTDVGGDLDTGQYDVVVSAGDDGVSGALTVSPGVDVTGDGNLATDTTGDGLLNDIDGDGTFDIFDVQALFSNLDSVVQSYPGLFNFNADDTPSGVSIFDVQGLFGQLA
jgi:hypothetical protein